MEQNKEHQNTFIQTLQARIERAEKAGNIDELFTPTGLNKALPIKLPALVKYFTPSDQQNIDEYGNKTDAQPKE